jgi:hypothetical protein
MLRRSPVRFAAGVACVAVFTAAFAVDGSLVGKIVPPYPAGLDELQGACIPGGPSHDQLCDFGLVVIGKRASDPDREAISLQLLATRDAEPGAANARWRVVDAVAVPKARKGYWLQIGSCRIDRVDGPGVVAFVRHGDSEYSRDVRWARRYDISSGKLVAVDSKRVDCVNEGLGV